MGDWERLQAALAEQWQLRVVTPDLLMLPTLQPALADRRAALPNDRRGLTVTIWDDREVLRVQPGYAEGHVHDSKPPRAAECVRDDHADCDTFHLMKAAAEVLRSIAGRENQPAESVFKNIKILKGVPAGRLVNIMNMGFGRSLGVSCGFCHVPGKWDLDDKDQKNTARLMFAMVQTINRDYIAKVPVDSGTPRPAVNCFTCHRGNSRPMGPEGPPPGKAAGCAAGIR